ncbi:hypothetical protein ABZV93_28345 [Actinopolymorpha sp. NPDC004070]|uniref:hypothetical protein n=1 Tax=Actinopolymorpha sp. NPDC004070 TaxID=3154548 RepID=UPI0033BE45E4
MALPAEANTTVVQGRLLDTAGQPISASLTFTPAPTRVMVRSAKVALFNKSATVNTDSATGSFAIEVLASDDPDL